MHFENDDTKPQPNQCDQCSDTFKGLSDRKQAETTETFECEFCDKRFAREDTLLQQKSKEQCIRKD